MGRYVLPLGLAALLYLNPIFAQTSNVPASSAVALVTQSEPAAELTLSKALDLAIEANPELMIARRELDAVAASRVQAGVFRNPELSVDVEDTRAVTRQTTYWLGQPFELGGKRGARIENAERAQDVASAELDMRFAGTRAAVIQGFYEVLAAQERLRLAQSSMELANRGLDAASRRVTAGKVSPVEETRARVAAASTRIELSQATTDLANARKRLSVQWGNPSPRFTTAVGELAALPNLPSLEALNGRLQTAPENVRARQEVGRREAMVKLEESKRYPDLVLRGGVQTYGETGGRANVVGFAIAIPIFDRNQGNIAEAKIRADQARDAQTATNVRLQSDLAQTYERLIAALQEVTTIREEILPGAQSALDASTRGFELGKFNFLDVLDAQRTLFLARGQYVRALGEVQRTVADLEAILGPQGASLFTGPRGKE